MKPGQRVLMSSQSNTEVSEYCGADWASYPFSRRFVTGYFVRFGESILSWKSKKQNTISRSSVEAEYRSITVTVAKLVWLLGLLKEIGIDTTQPTKIYTDSNSTMQIESNPVYHKRTKHIEIDCNFIREKINQVLVTVNYIPTSDQPADVLTKGLSKAYHEHLLSNLGILNLFGIT